MINIKKISLFVITAISSACHYSLAVEFNADQLLLLPLIQTQPSLLYGAPPQISQNLQSSLEDLVNAYLTNHEEVEQDSNASAWLTPLEIRSYNLELLHNYLSDLKKSKKAPVPQMVLDVLKFKLEELNSKKGAALENLWSWGNNIEDIENTDNEDILYTDNADQELLEH